MTVPRILVVEDETIVALDIRQQLARQGYAVAGQASRGEQAVALAESLRPDLVLMDIQLPDIDGIEALRRIRADAALDAVPVIAVSASVMPDDQHKIVTSGFDAFVTKPINLKAFLDTVQRFLTEGRRR